MNPSSSAALFVVVFLAGLGLRFAMHSPDIEVFTAATPETISSSTKVEKPAIHRPSLQEIAAVTQGSERLQLELRYLDGASVEEVEALVSQREGKFLFGWEPIFHRWFEVDATGALEYVRVGEDELRSPIDDRLIAGYAAFLEVDQEGAIAAALTDPTETELAVVIDLLATLDPVRGSQLLLAGTAQLRRRFNNRLPDYFSHGGVDDLEALAELDMGISEDGFFDDNLHFILAAEAATDPDGALFRAQSQRGVMNRSSAVALVLGSVADTNPQKAVKLLDDIDSAYERALGGGEIAARWVTRDIGATHAWIHSMPRGMEKETAVSRAAFVLLRSDPASALEFISSFEGELNGYWNPSEVDVDPIIRPPESFSSYNYPDGTLLMEIWDTPSLDTFIRESPQEALPLLMRLPPTMNSAIDLSRPIVSAMHKFPAATRDWLDSMPEGEARELLESHYVDANNLQEAPVDE